MLLVCAGDRRHDLLLAGMTTRQRLRQFRGSCEPSRRQLIHPALRCPRVRSEISLGSAKRYTNQNTSRPRRAGCFSRSRLPEETCFSRPRGMQSFTRRLNKTLVMGSLRCRKRAWLLVHEPPAVEESASFPLAVGERLQRFVPTYFGPGVDLSSYRSMNKALAATYEALCDPDVQRIYEATFEVDGVLVRADVLERAPEDDYTWDLIEVKSSSSVREDHLMDLAVQSYVIRRDGSVDLRKASLASINGEFKLPKADPALTDQERYKGLFTLTTLPLSPCSDEDDLPLSANESKTNEKTSDETRARFLAIKEEIAWMHEHILDGDASCPEVEVGSHCNKPFPCEFLEQCERHIHPEAEIPVRILPNTGRVLSKEFAAKGIADLRDVPAKSLKTPLHRTIHRAHEKNIAVRSAKVRPMLCSLPWPRYSMDFETVQQIVPVLAGSTPRDSIPFQWSVHKWSSPGETPSLDGGASFLSFDLDNVHRRFADSLLEAVGKEGPIFVHSIAAERSVLKKLANHPSCKDIKEALRKVQSRMVCTLKLCKEHYYAPEQMGSFSLKAVVKGIPNSEVRYMDGGAVSNGQDAQIAWFIYNKENTSAKQREALAADLVRYCAKDTFALVELIEYLSLDDTAFVRARENSALGVRAQEAISSS